MASADKSKMHQLPGNHIENGIQNNQPNPENSFLSGIKQCLLSFIFRGIWNEETDQTLVGYFDFPIHVTFQASEHFDRFIVSHLSNSDAVRFLNL